MDKVNFIKRLKGVLEGQNRYASLASDDVVDIPKVLCCLEQHLDDEVHKDFLTSIKDYTSIGFLHKSDDWYTYGSLEIHVSNSLLYEIIILEENEPLGYCNCQEGDEGYIDSKKCCGHDCDWTRPALEIHKKERIVECSWEGTQHDYWDYENTFKVEQEEKQRLETKKKMDELRKTIEKAQEELAQLELELDVKENGVQLVKMS